MKSGMLLVCSRPVLPALLTMTVALCAQAEDPRYAVTDLGALGGGYSYAYGINNAGVVAGAISSLARLSVFFNSR